MAKKIFLVEDESSIQEMYVMILEKNGFEVEAVEDGEAAIAKLTDSGVNYDLILLDIMLPKMDGISVLKQIKADGSPAKEIPVFMLTNLGQEDLIKDATESGAAGYWIKSNIFPVDLATKIKEFLGDA